MLDIEPGVLEAIKTTESNKAQSCKFTRNVEDLAEKNQSSTFLVCCHYSVGVFEVSSDLKLKYNC